MNCVFLCDVAIFIYTVFSLRNIIAGILEIVYNKRKLFLLIS